MNAVTIYRLARWCFEHKVPLLPKLLQGLIFFLFNTYLPYQAQLGRNTRLGHRGIGVVINADSIIGNNVLIRAHVTIGKKTSDGKAPIIEDNVVIGDGAKVLGDVRIGEGAVIGANAVVVSDVPPNSTAVGVPAKIKDN